MDYSTVVKELFSRFPEFEAKYRADFAHLGDEASWQYRIWLATQRLQLRAEKKANTISARLRALINNLKLK